MKPDQKWDDVGPLQLAENQKRHCILNLLKQLHRTKKSQELNLSKLKLEVVVFINTDTSKRQLRLKVSPGAMTGKAGRHLHMGKDGVHLDGSPAIHMGQCEHFCVRYCAQGYLDSTPHFCPHRGLNYDPAASQPTPPTD